MIKFVNEYRYSKEDSIAVMNAYNRFWKRKLVSRYGPLLAGAFSLYLYLSTGLVRFMVFAIVLLLLCALSFIQVSLGAKYDAARIAEETGRPDPMMRYEIDSELRIYRAGKPFLAIPLEDIVGAKQVGGALAIFTAGNCTALFKDDKFLEGGAVALRAFLRERKVTVK